MTVVTAHAAAKPYASHAKCCGHGEGEKGGGGADEACEQDRCGQRILWRVGQREAERDCDVEQKIADDVEKRAALPLAPMIAALSRDATRVQGTAVFMTSTPDEMPAAMLHNLKHNKILHERNIVLHVHFDDVPLVTRANRVKVEDLGNGFFKMVVNYGFMNAPDIPKALTIAAKDHGIDFEMMDTSFFVSREVLVPTPCLRTSVWRQRLFSLMARNAQSATAYFQISTNRVLVLGAQVKC